jgi:hypothetical protein
MSTSIRQRPLFTKPVPVGQDIIFVLKNDAIVLNEIQVKFVAEVHISDGQPVNLASTTDLIGTFKTIPNTKGAGIFNFRDIIEAYVSSDNRTAFRALVKGEADSELDGGTYPLHLIDKWSRNRNLARHFAVKFSVQYLDQATSSATFGEVIQVDFRNSANHFIFNGYISNSEKLEIGGFYGNSFGFNMRENPNDYEIAGSSTANPDAKFLTNLPIEQYVNKNDYGTLALFRGKHIKNVRVRYKKRNAGITTLSYGTSSANGLGTQGSNIQRQFAYLGAGPANIRQWDSGFATELDNDNVEYYTVDIRNDSNFVTSVTMKYYVNCPETKGYEPIRLCWLNQWGAWDYFTFTMKSIKTFSTQGSTYNQLGGSWNDEKFKLNSFKGGKKSFRVNTTERIKVNTDFITEEEGKAFEYMINSPEIRMLSGFISETNTEFLANANNEYVQPVRLVTTSINRKTKANDKLIQFTFDIEKSKTLRTQSI